MTWEEDMQVYYRGSDEARRLMSGVGQLERVRTQQIIERFMPPAPADILDVGGASGVYALWMARFGYRVHLVDLVQRHVEEARIASDAQSEAPLASIQLGDARDLTWEDESFDGVLLLGPLYHMPVRADRIRALKEVLRVLKPGGVLLAAGISRFASMLAGLHDGEMKKPEFWEIVQGDLTDGHHHNPARTPKYFTETFIHHPDGLRHEVRQAGFTLEAVLGVEGPGCLVNEFDTWWEDPIQREKLLDIAERLESEPAMLGIGPHLIAVGRKEGPID